MVYMSRLHITVSFRTKAKPDMVPYRLEPQRYSACPASWHAGLVQAYAQAWLPSILARRPCTGLCPGLAAQHPGTQTLYRPMPRLGCPASWHADLVQAYAQAWLPSILARRPCTGLCPGLAAQHPGTQALYRPMPRLGCPASWHADLVQAYAQAWLPSILARRPCTGLCPGLAAQHPGTQTLYRPMPRLGCPASWHADLVQAYAQAWLPSILARRPCTGLCPGLAAQHPGTQTLYRPMPRLGCPASWHADLVQAYAQAWLPSILARRPCTGLCPGLAAQHPGTQTLYRPMPRLGCPASWHADLVQAYAQAWLPSILARRPCTGLCPGLAAQHPGSQTLYRPMPRLGCPASWHADLVQAYAQAWLPSILARRPCTGLCPGLAAQHPGTQALYRPMPRLACPASWHAGLVQAYAQAWLPSILARRHCTGLCPGLAAQHPGTQTLYRPMPRLGCPASWHAGLVQAYA